MSDEQEIFDEMTELRDRVVALAEATPRGSDRWSHLAIVAVDLTHAAGHAGAAAGLPDSQCRMPQCESHRQQLMRAQS